MHRKRLLPWLLSAVAIAACGNPEAQPGSCAGVPCETGGTNTATTGGTTSALGGNAGDPASGGQASGSAPSASGGSLAGGSPSSIGGARSAGGGSPSSGGTAPGSCEAGTTATAWATECPTTRATCAPGSWTARPEGSDGHPLQAESEHFAIYYFTSDPDGTGPLEGFSNPSSSAIQNALTTLEGLWDSYFGPPILFPEPYCDSATKTKVGAHLDDSYPLWGGGWGSGYMGLWVGAGALADRWGLAHEFMHGVQTTTQGFPDCGGNGCWIYESHANWMPHQVYHDDVHCSEMLVNAPHLYYGSTRDRYCNWQFFEFLKDEHCYSAVHEMWAYEAPNGQRDPWQKLMLSQDWSIEELNDVFGEWALHNVTFDYQDPTGEDQGATYRQKYGPISGDPGAFTERRLRRTRLEALGEDFAETHRFVSPYYWAPQRWGYNVVELAPEDGASEVRVRFRGVLQEEANPGWRYGLVATNAAGTIARYGRLGRDSEGEVSLCLEPDEKLFLVVTATPTVYQKIVWGSPGDGTPYPNIYRYPYMVELEGAWPEGFEQGARGPCPEGTMRHENGGGCAPANLAETVYVGPYARVLGGTVSGAARIEDQATIVSGTISGGTVGALSLVGVQSHQNHQAATFNVQGSAKLLATFYPMGWFASNQTLGGTATYLGDLEVYSQSKTSNTFFGLVDDNWSGVASAPEVTTPPPYAWRD